MSGRTAKRISLRPSGFDELGLRRALANRVVPLLVAAMAFLASLAAAGWSGAEVLTRQWQTAASATLTVQVPRGGEPDAKGGATRAATVQSDLTATAGVESTEILSEEKLNALLRPWLGTDIKNLAVPIPAVVAAHLAPGTIDLSELSSRLAADAPGTIVEHHAAWVGELGTLVRSLQLCSGLILLIVALMTAAVISVAVRSGLAMQREAILIVNQLGATDGYIARRVAARAALSSAAGAFAGGALALPVIFGLTTLAAPLSGLGTPVDALADPSHLLPVALWLLPAILPAVATAIGYLTAQITVHRWLRRMTSAPMSYMA